MKTIKSDIKTLFFSGKGQLKSGDNKKFKFSKSITVALLLAACCTAGCKKLVNVKPPATSLTAENVYLTDPTAVAVMTGIYADMTSGTFPLVAGPSGISFFCGLSADEYTLSTSFAVNPEIGYYTNTLTSTGNGGTEFWNMTYPYIFKCNDAIAGLTASTTLTPAVKSQLLGEAYFMRSFLYFYLTNLYGDLPLALSTDYKVNESLSRTPQAQVYQQIVSDLKTAQNLLGATYTDGTLLAASPDRLRPTKWAADALLARVYLYSSDNADAIIQSTKVISNPSSFSLSSLNNAFLMASLGNNEAIWQLQSVTTAPSNTLDGTSFIITSTGLSNAQPLYLSNSLLNSFETGDNRKTNWIDTITVAGSLYYFPYKYKVNSGTAVTEYQMVLRLGEQYLIRAEAEAQLGQLVPAATDLNMIRNRAGLPNTTATTQTALLAAILHERQVEFFSELGNRWLDLKRTGNINAVMGAGGACALKGGTWNPNQALYPLPLSDVQQDPNLKQNPGY